MKNDKLVPTTTVGVGRAFELTEPGAEGYHQSALAKLCWHNTAVKLIALQSHQEAASIQMWLPQRQ